MLSSRILVLLAGGLCINASAARLARPAPWVLPPDRPAHCGIVIKLRKRANRQMQTIVFRSALNTEDQCRRLAALHEPNFNPESDETKQVAYTWSGPRSRSARRGKAVAARRSNRRRAQ